MTIEAILIDQREPDWVKALTFGCASVAVTLLDVADLWITTGDGALVLVERKTASDLLNTLRDDRLFGQLTTMRERSTWAYLAICGNLLAGRDGKALVDGRESGWAWASLQGALLTAQEIGVNILWVPSEYDYEGAVIRLANRDRSPLRVRPPRATSVLSEAEAILASLPGVGEQRASAIVEYCGTAANGIYALTTLADIPIPGIGTGVKRRVRRALGLPDDMALQPIAELAGEKAE